MDIKNNIKKGFTASLPIVVGYFPIAMAFGLLAKNTEISFRDTSLFSMMVFAGASQFMALDFIRAGVSAGSIILATFLLNLRHMMMSASLAVNLDNIKKIHLPVLAFGITDETFSVSSFNKDRINLSFILTLHSMSYSSWVAGTMVGFLIGEILPSSLQSSLSIGLYAMFAALLLPAFRGNGKVLILSMVSILIYVVLYYSSLFKSGWDIILGIILSSAIGTFIFKNEGDLD